VVTNRGGLFFSPPDAGGSIGAPALRCIGYIPQRPSLFNRSILHNIVYPSLLGIDGEQAKHAKGSPAVVAALEQKVWSVAQKLGLAPMLASLPRGLHTPAGKNGSALSGGQRQAVWLMRTFMREPRVQLLLLDEPTAAMDPESRVAVAHAIRLFGATTVVVTHDEQLARDIEATRLIDFAKM
jgi:ABC-type multidrug transport system fused ATPase/permease subunit